MLGVVESVVGVAGKVLNKFVQDKDLKAKLEHELNTAFHSANLAQIDLNKQEAAHKSMFVAGWRPFIGWVCGVALAYHFVLSPLITFGFAIAGFDKQLPVFDFSQLSTILMGMLGLGGLRSYEKVKKVSREN